MLRTKRVAVVLVLALFVAIGWGCTTAGVNFDSDVAQAIQVGVDTRDSVEQQLGPPRQKMGPPKGAAAGCVERWMYRYAHFGTFRNWVKVLVVDFDAAGVVCYSGYDEQ